MFQRPRTPLAGFVPASAADARWKGALVALCAVGFFFTALQFASDIALGSHEWFGWWDETAARVNPFTLAAIDVIPNGAAARAGIRVGDRFDLRRQSLDGRVGLLWQPVANRPVAYVVQRDGASLTAVVTASSMWDQNAWLKIPFSLIEGTSLLFLMGCALLIALRRSTSFNARAVVLFLALFVSGRATRPQTIVIPNATLYVLLGMLSEVLTFAAFCVLIALAANFGERKPWRRGLELLAYAVNAGVFAVGLAGCWAVYSMAFDPLPIVFGSAWSFFFALVATLLIALVAVAAVVSSPRSERPRAGWLLLPLPVSVTISTLFDSIAGFGYSWTLLITLVSFISIAALAGAALVTYALLGRRVLDVGFVLSRTIVVAIVSLIVLVSFILLEWALGTVLAGASHATGIAANVALALALGLSMTFIHRRVDDAVDRLMFRKRHDDERALHDFAREAAFVTDPESLLDRAIENVRDHTDARAAALLVRQNGGYRAVRSFGDAPAQAGENDAAVLALKAWHKPLDPHRYTTVLFGDLALPMSARGQLLGIVLCGERAGGEVYAPDEIEALTQFAFGVGSALDTLTVDYGDTQRRILKLQEEILDQLRVIATAIRR
ncbi:MAG: hypothetical protein WAK19_07210 [Candidatus Cybelea sp.]